MNKAGLFCLVEGRNAHAFFSSSIPRPLYKHMYAIVLPYFHLYA